eukprot:759676_1
MLKSIESEQFKNVQKLFELSLKKYQCLTIGDTLRIQNEKNVHLFEVTDVLSAQSIASITPFNIVSLVDTDVAVDFLPPKDTPIDTEEQKKATRDIGYDTNIPQPNDIVNTTLSSGTNVDQDKINDYKTPQDIQKSFSGTGQKLDDNIIEKKKTS